MISEVPGLPSSRAGAAGEARDRPEFNNFVGARGNLNWFLQSHFAVVFSTIQHDTSRLKALPDAAAIFKF
jgi:hypothetical protein